MGFLEKDVCCHAEAQGVQDVLDPIDLSPIGDVMLFKEQQKYVYSVLLNTIKDPVLKSIIINAKQQG